MTQKDILKSSFSEDDDGEFEYPFVIVATLKASWSGICGADEDHAYKRNDIIGVLERSDNPMIPPQPKWCCNKCVRSLPHKKALVGE